MQNELTEIEKQWARGTTRRMAPGGDLYRAPLSRREITAPLSWHEKQLAKCRRYGVLANGEIGTEVVR